jgi:thiol-disulfide isomerase/thioredoxin
MRRFALVIALAACQSANHDPPAPAPQKLELVDAPATPAGSDAAPMIASEFARAEHDHKRLVVYVGATWCEPCQSFHAAAEAGKLDQTFGSLRLLVFDSDRDGEALETAGYRSQMIPLFALPRPDGRSTGKQIEGSIKGADAVKQISPRLEALLARP